MRTFREYLKGDENSHIDAYSERDVLMMQEGWSAALESVLGYSEDQEPGRVSPLGYQPGEKKDTRNARIPEWIGRGK